ncbi:MAG: hypothetical protein J6W92_04435 [Paludibacteraceae bacterium]|jgi:hypothetical protein|nr:hypothetical protein [Paludibacteraceae bacterium]
MQDSDLNILLKHATRERDLLKGHARELNAAADTHDALIAALHDMAKDKKELLDENKQLKSENTLLKQAPSINNTFTAPINNLIQHADNITYSQS